MNLPIDIPSCGPGIIVDLFAGGGGASEGIRMALGRDPDVAINHDPEAVAMHKANHPGTTHLIENVWAVDPTWATKGRPVAVLWASPDCTHHSKAKGSAPTRDDKRRSLACVITEKWIPAVWPKTIIMENVEEFKDWGPVDCDGHVIKSQAGDTFRWFLRRLRRFGYSVQYRELRACDYGAPTIRKRLFLVAKRSGRIVWPEPTHGPGCPELCRTAADCIDWSIPCPSIFERTRPLAEATCRRIAKGIMRYVVNNPRPFVVTYYGSKGPDFRGHGIDEPLRTQTTENRHALVMPFLAKHYSGVVGSEMAAPLGTVTTVDHHSLVAASLVRQFGHSVGDSASDPVGTITAGGGGKTLLSTAHLVKLRGSCRDGQQVDAAMSTITAGGNHFGLVHAFLLKYYGSDQDPRIAEPLHTITTRDRFGVVTVHVQGEPYYIADIGLRMLQPRELYRAQGFPDSYIIGDDPDQGLSLTKAAQVRMCGNSVCPPMAAALVRANVDAAALGRRDVA